MADFTAISQLAYQLWEKGGRREGTAEQDWLEAERILAGRMRTPSSTPLTARAVDHLLTAPGSPPPAAPARPRKAPGKISAAKPSAGKASAKARKSAPLETPKVGSRDAPGG